MPLPQGIPTIDGTIRLAESVLFREVAAFSDAFLARNNAELTQYAHKWVSDPMRQWSRRWEYPFCADHLRSRFEGSAGERPQVLDAGSGITFFPYFLASKGMAVRCCDIDASLAGIFPHVNAVTGAEIPFSAASLAKLPYADESFDAATCISVLEHCSETAEIIEEFSRVLRPGGLLVLTFDVSLDGRWEIPPDKAADLLRSVARRFGEGAEDLAALLRFDAEPAILTTKYAHQHDPRSLPWGILSDLKSLSRLKLPRRPHKLLTCCALAVPRRAGS